MFPSKYLKGSDLPGVGIVVTIANVKAEQLYTPGKGKAQKFVMYCQGKTKGIVLSKGLAFQIADILGEKDADNWTGHKVVLYPEVMSVGGEQVTAIRARSTLNGSGGNGNAQ
jgi:hypothetical protein